jgi:hypothetical protein
VNTNNDVGDDVIVDAGGVLVDAVIFNARESPSISLSSTTSSTSSSSSSSSSTLSSLYGAPPLARSQSHPMRMSLVSAWTAYNDNDNDADALSTDAQTLVSPRRRRARARPKTIKELADSPTRVVMSITTSSTPPRLARNSPRHIKHPAAAVVHVVDIDSARMPRRSSVVAAAAAAAIKRDQHTSEPLVFVSTTN